MNTMTATIGINQRIPISVVTLTLEATLRGEANNDYFMQLAGTAYAGENRKKKTVQVINHLTTRNPLLPYMQENCDTMLSALRSTADRPLLMTALLTAAYGFAYDAVTTMGKYFHIQDEVNSKLIVEKMASKYGANRSLPNALYSVLPMLIEAGLLTRPQVGIYKAVRQPNASEFARELYQRAWSLHNPSYAASDAADTHSFFEFIR